jgi:hypothetical protein
MEAAENFKNKMFQVRYKSVWGTICDDNFGEAEATVACRLGSIYGCAYTRALFHTVIGKSERNNIMNVPCSS